MLNELWKHSSTAQELIAEGREEEARELARLALEGRFETLSDDLIQAVNQAGEATLREVIKHAYHDSLEQIRGRLGLHS